MVDPRVVAIRLKEMDLRLARLRDIQGEGKDRFLQEQLVQAAAERNLQIAIQAAIDIATHMLAEGSAGAPADYASTFRMLADAGILEKELAGRLAQAAGLHNILVHLYLEINPERIWESLSKLRDLEEFAFQVSKRLP